MNPTSQQFIDHIKSLKKERQQLNDLLGADPAGAYVYYLVPYPNVVKIISNNGIFPKNFSPNHLDLSDNSIQSRREQNIHFEHGGELYKVRLHDCVNFFLNPINNTYFSFRRNALIRQRIGDPLSKLVCILEMDIQELLKLDESMWIVSDRNLAVSGSKTTNKNEEYQSYDWQRIYRVNGNKIDKEENTFRSAEFLVFMNRPEEKQMASWIAIHRILIYENDARGSEKGFQKSHSLEMSIFRESTNSILSDPLAYDKKWANQVHQLVDNKCLEILYPLNRIKTIEYEFGTSLFASYKNPVIGGGGYHGTNHTCRVLFWALVLVQIYQKEGVELNESEISALLVAVFFHDTLRSNNEIEEWHGKLAASEKKGIIEKLLPPEVIIRCLNAIESHSRGINDHIEDPIAKILLDADALDRGRFAPPGDSGGCNPKEFYSTTLKTDIKFSYVLMWSAFHLAKITKFCANIEESCWDFVYSIRASMALIAKMDGLEEELTSVCNDLCYKLVMSRKPGRWDKMQFPKWG